VENYTIAVDAMGGDYGPCVTVPAVIKALADLPHVQIILVGNSNQITKILQKYHYNPCQLTIKHTTDVVMMNDLPAMALKYKTASSMRIAIDLVKTGQAEACVSAGNTGALLAISRYVLKTLPGIDRPAIIGSLFATAEQKNLQILDLGANVDMSAKNLYQFALMGSVLVSVVENITRPKVGLLNLDAVHPAANKIVQQTDALLASSTEINYCGLLTPQKIFSKDADLVVCDGFIGNIVLKVAEGSASYLQFLLKNNFKKYNWLTKITAILIDPLIQSVFKTISSDYCNGATLLGLQKIVVKSHGNAGVMGFTQAIKHATIQIEKKVLTQFAARLNNAP
jgi:glycerol-3-phosphate acyltransferase PlsX